MGLGKTYSTKYLVDSNGNTGAANQVLVSTATGVDWVDGSGSGIIGGPYLPLSAGSGYPLTGDLHLSTGLIKLASQITTKIELVTNQMTLYAGGLVVLTGYNASQDGVEIGNPTGDMDITLSGGANQRILYLEGSSGNVGIGTTTLNRSGLGIDHKVLTVGRDTEMGMLELQGTRTSDADLGRIAWLNAGTRLSEIVVSRIDNNTSTKMSFRTSDTGSLSTKMTILPNGNVGIGTIGPGAKLTVDGVGYSFIAGYDSGNRRVHIGLDSIGEPSIQGTLSNGTARQISINPNGGNVGIGTVSPDSKLDVTGGDITVNTSGTGFMNFKYGAVGSETARGSITTDGIDLKVNATADLLLLPTGNVGIGTTNPSRRLTVMTSPQAAMTAGTASGHFFLTNTGGSSGLYGLYGGVTSDGDGWFQSARNDSATYYNLLLQANGGNVGIGTVSPGNKLEVRGVAGGNHFVVGSTGYDLLKVAGSSITMQPYPAGNGTDGIYIKAYDSGYALRDVIRVINASAATSPHLLLQPSGGNVGIGTASPLGRLQVNEYTVASQGNQNIHGEVSVFANSGDESLFLGIKNAAYPNRGWAFNPITDGVNSNLQIKEHGASGVRMTILSGGNVGIGTTTPVSTLQIVATTTEQITSELTDAGSRKGLLTLSGLSNQVAGAGGGIVFAGNGTTSYAAIKGLLSNGGGNTQGSIAFSTRALQTDTALTERMRITSAGGISFGSGGTAYGTSGQVLTSAGNASPTWTTPTTGTVTGSGAATQVAFWDSASSLGGNNNLWWDNTNGHLGINDTSPGSALKVVSGTSETSIYTVDINHVRNDADVATTAMRINMDLSGADTTTATRTNYGLYLDIDSSADGDATNEHRIYGVASQINFTGFSDQAWGASFVAESNYTGAKTAQLIGVYGSAVHDTASTSGGVSNMYGVYGTSSIQDLGDVDNAYGGYFSVSIGTSRGNANVGVTTGVEGKILIDKATTISYGDMIGMSSIIDNNEGTVPTFGNQYLFKGDYQGTKGPAAYGIYVEGDKHYFEGDIGIGVTSPATKLHVNGDIGAYTSDWVATVSGSRLLMKTFASTGATYSLIQAQDVGGNSNNDLVLNPYGGDVGIGTPSPGTKLDVSGVITATGGTSTEWNTAYDNRITSLTTTGTSGAATLISNVLNIPNYADGQGVTSVTAGNGMSFTTITGIGPVTMGTPGTLTSATTNAVTTTSHTHSITTGIANTNIVKINSTTVATGEYARFTTTGLESRTAAEVATDIGAVTGSGAATRVAFWNGTNSLTSDVNLYWDNTNDRLGIGTTTPGSELEVDGEITTTTITYPEPAVIESSAYNGEIVYFGSQISMTEGKLMVLEESVAGLTWYQAKDSTTALATGMLGIALGTTASAGVLVRGIAKNSAWSSFSAGKKLYLSPTGGSISNSITQDTNDFVRIVGYALGGNKIYFCPDNTYIQNA
jgi:hypothetical protein